MDTNTISWVAPEREHQEHGSDWYWTLGIISASLAIAFIIAGNMLLSIIIVLGMGILLLTAHHQPRIVEYKISRTGIHAGDKMYPWGSLHSFWIIEKEEDATDYHQPKLFLVSKKGYMPHIIVPVNELVLEDVRDVVSEVLPEEPRAEPITDRLARKIGF